jgi:thiamine biosynthesis lipoprotein
MATRFEIVLYGDKPDSLRAAAEEALDEVQRLESKLSLYRPDSEISHLNSRADREPVRVSSELFRLLLQASRLHEETGGAFDITIGPLMRAWRFMEDSGHVPSREAVERARECVGMHRVVLDPDQQSVRFSQPGVTLDLGAIGKGYAIEQAAGILREAGVASALIHGGTSTSYGIGSPPGEEFWKVAIERPPHDDSNSAPGLLAVVPLRDRGLSVSAVWGKAFKSRGSTYGHIIDPRTGRPVHGAILAAVSIASATESDALSTALLTLGIQDHDKIASLRPGIGTLVVEEPDPLREQLSMCSSGIEIHR